MTWHLEAVPEDGGTLWNILETRPDGTLERLGTFVNKLSAQNCITGYEWLASMASGRMSIPEPPAPPAPKKRTPTKKTTPQTRGKR